MKTDAELVREARRDPEALAELYRRHAQRLHAWLRAQVSPQIACELVGETFAQAALSLSRFKDPGGGSASPWLFGIAKNLLRRYYESIGARGGGWECGSSCTTPTSRACTSATPPSG